MKIDKENFRDNLFILTSPCFYIYALYLILNKLFHILFEYFAFKDVYFYLFRMNEYKWEKANFNHARYLFKKSKSVFRKIMILKIYKKQRKNCK